MITERTLRQWRREALCIKENVNKLSRTRPEGLSTDVLMQGELAERILRLTQELSDINLVKVVK